MKRVRGLLPTSDAEAYLVGGWVRDRLLGRKTRDIDIAVGVSAPKFARQAAAALNGHYVLLDKAEGIARVVLLEDDAARETQWHLDFSTIRGTIESDLSRRDFTIDAMAIDLNEIGKRSPPRLIDPFGGRKDLEAESIRAVSPKVFRDDPARLLRGVRLAAELGFNIDARTEAMIRRQNHLISRVASERVRDELCHILSVGNAARSIFHLDHLGLLTAIIPELDFTKGVDQPYEHYWDVFNHSVQSVATLERLFDKKTGAELLGLAPHMATHIGDFEEEISPILTRGGLVKLAILLHDIAKPQTKALEPDGRAHFYGHPTQGAEAVGGIMQRLRFSNRETKMVQKMIESHLRLWQMGGDQGLPTRRAIYRYFRDTADVSIDIMFLTLADFLATQGPNLDTAEWERHSRLMEYVLAKREEDETVAAPPKLIDGHDLMREFGLKPGPRIGEILEVVREAQGAGEISTKEEALALARKRLAKRQPRLKVIS
ncbi:MAG: CCA tRNA nucleotidyltransferase [Dehalococcoidia bacterium]|nr:CCA tRNA nucleotidyltransferase [Dehalococcoidia bacterium]